MDYLFEKEMKDIENLVFGLSVEASFGIERERILVFDKAEDNIRIVGWTSKTPLEDINEVYTVDYGVIEKIKELIRTTGILGVDELELPDMFQLDGNTNTYYFSDGERTNEIETDEFFKIYCKFNNKPNAKILKKTLITIQDLLVTQGKVTIDICV